MRHLQIQDPDYSINYFEGIYCKRLAIYNKIHGPAEAFAQNFTVTKLFSFITMSHF